MRRAYLSGELHLLPFPGSLLFWGTPGYMRLSNKLPQAIQVPFLHTVARHEGPQGLRVPQSGWMHEPNQDKPEPESHHGPVRNSFIRTHRWARVRRHQDEIALLAREDKLAHVLFSTQPEDLDLYGKPMARNVQIWTQEYELLLDGPRASAEEIKNAFSSLGTGGQFGYRFLFPAMRVGTHEVYWHRPITGCLRAGSDEPAFFPDGPLGYLTCYSSTKELDLNKPVELWPRLRMREEHLAATEIFEHSSDDHPHQTAVNVRKVPDTGALLDKPLTRGFARSLLSLPKEGTLKEWLNTLPGRANDPARGRRLSDRLCTIVENGNPALNRRGVKQPAGSLTFRRTARRSFEVRYWQAIRFLAEGRFINKCNADCIQDDVTREMLRHDHRDLEALGDYLLGHYHRAIAACGMKGKALAGELPFRWKTDFDFEWYGGWRNNQKKLTHERNIAIVIPGRNRSEAVIMADHYDTAYMEDYDISRTGYHDSHDTMANIDLDYGAAVISIAIEAVARASNLGDGSPNC